MPGYKLAEKYKVNPATISKWARKYGVTLIRKGNRHWNSKLEEYDIILIFALYKEGLQVKEIAVKMDVSPTTITDVITGVTWKHIKRPA